MQFVYFNPLLHTTSSKDIWLKFQFWNKKGPWKEFFYEYLVYDRVGIDDERGSLGIYLKNRCYIEFTNWRLNIDFVYLT